MYPGWRLHPLAGGLAGFWSVTVTANRRIIFRFELGVPHHDHVALGRAPSPALLGRAFDVDLIDYH